ncbi:MAG TPA: phosphate signaling complex protein PhoU [Alphaproteobacteria bacterium]
MADEHIVKSYDEQLNRLTTLIGRMGGLAEAQIASAIDAVVKRDTELAASVVESDQKIDNLEREIDDQAISLLALRQPMARDLRSVVAALRIASDVERIADYAANVAKRAIALSQMAPVRPIHAIPRMGRVVQQMVKDVLDAHAARDVDKAIDVWNRDEELDDMYSSLFRELLTYMMEDPRNITASTHLLFIAKNLERIGDHATNIAETIHFLVRGTQLRTARPKSDATSFTIVRPENGGSGA